MFDLQLRKAPFFRILLPFACGIATCSSATLPPVWILLSALICFSLSLLIYTACLYTHSLLLNRLFGLSASAFLFFSGGCLYQSGQPGKLPVAQKKETWIGSVSAIPERKPGSHKVLLQHVTSCAEGIVLPGKLLLYLKLQEDTLPPPPGALIALYCRPEPFAGPANPYDFDFRSHYSLRDIYYRSWVPAGHWKQINPAGSGTTASLPGILNTMTGGPKILVERYRYHLSAQLTQLFPEKRVSALLKAIYLGNREGLAQEQKEVFSRAGAMHFLAVSGLHAGIVCYLLYLILGRVPVLKNLLTGKTLVGLAMIWGYALLTGLSVPVTRACLMLSLWMLARLSRGSANSLNILFLTALVILALNPDMLLDIGFQLSFSAVTGILLLFPLMYERMRRPNQLADKIIALILVSLAAQAGTLPLSLYYFHQLPHYFILTNLLVTPLLALLLYAAPLLFLTGMIPALTPLLLKVIDNLACLLLFLVQLVEKLPGSFSSGYHPTPAMVCCSYLIILACCHLFYFRKRKALLVILGSVLMLGALCTFRDAGIRNQLSIHIYHLRDSYALNILSGKENILIAEPHVKQAYVWQDLQEFWDKKGVKEPQWFTGEAIDIQGACRILPSEPVFLQAGHIRMGWMSSPPDQQLLKHLPQLDYLVVSHHSLPVNRTVSLAGRAGMIIIDGSNNQRYTRKLRAACLREGISVYSTGNSGSYCIDLEIKTVNK